MRKMEKCYEQVFQSSFVLLQSLAAIHWQQCYRKRKYSHLLAKNSKFDSFIYFSAPNVFSLQAATRQKYKIKRVFTSWAKTKSKTGRGNLLSLLCGAEKESNLVVNVLVNFLIPIWFWYTLLVSSDVPSTPHPLEAREKSALEQKRRFRNSYAVL